MVKNEYQTKIKHSSWKFFVVAGDGWYRNRLLKGIFTFISKKEVSLIKHGQDMLQVHYSNHLKRSWRLFKNKDNCANKD